MPSRAGRVQAFVYLQGAGRAAAVVVVLVWRGPVGLRLAVNIYLFEFDVSFGLHVFFFHHSMQFDGSFGLHAVMKKKNLYRKLGLLVLPGNICWCRAYLFCQIDEDPSKIAAATTTSVSAAKMRRRDPYFVGGCCRRSPLQVDAYF